MHTQLLNHLVPLEALGERERERKREREGERGGERGRERAERERDSRERKRERKREMNGREDRDRLDWIGKVGNLIVVYVPVRLLTCLCVWLLGLSPTKIFFGRPKLD